MVAVMRVVVAEAEQGGLVSVPLICVLVHGLAVCSIAFASRVAVADVAASCIGANGTMIRRGAATLAIVTATGLAHSTGDIVRRTTIPTPPMQWAQFTRKSPR